MESSMTTSEWIGLGISYAYAIGLLLTGEALHRFAGLPADLTRKIIHIGAGMWVFGVLALFDRWEIGIVPFATFIFVNFHSLSLPGCASDGPRGQFARHDLLRAGDHADLCVPVASTGSC